MHEQASDVFLSAAAKLAKRWVSVRLRAERVRFCSNERRVSGGPFILSPRRTTDTRTTSVTLPLAPGGRSWSMLASAGSEAQASMIPCTSSSGMFIPVVSEKTRGLSK